MDDPNRAAERIMPWEFKHPHVGDFEETMLREIDDSLFPGVGLWPYGENGLGFYYWPLR